MEKVEPCEIRGSSSFPELIQSCALCRFTREHVYCTRTYNNRPIAAFWVCDGCRFIGPGPEDKQDFSRAAGQAPVIHDEAIQKPILGHSSLLTRIKRVPSRKSSVQAILNEVVAGAAPFRSSRKGLSGDGCHDDVIRQILYVQERPSLAYNLLHFEYPSHPPDPNYVWKYSWTQNGFTRQRSKMLSFNLLSRHDVWAEIFETDLARAQDMSFYFCPGDSEGHEEQYCSLLNLLENEDLAMKSCMNDVVELLLFHSKQLCYCQDVELESPHFVWGKIRSKKSEHSDANSLANCISRIRARASDVGTSDVTPGFTSKVTSKVNDGEISGRFSVLIEIPVRYDKALVDAMTMAASGEDVSRKAAPKTMPSETNEAAELAPTTKKGRDVAYVP